jgi:heat-inducible transcriptional repressor
MEMFMTSLTERQKLILALVVREYVRTIDPVSSGSLVDTYRLDVSSATVRNEMAHLTEVGFLHQPYTSAGRVPTENGYRYFVQELMGPVELPRHVQQMIRHQFFQARRDVDDWLALSASVLAQHTSVASLVTPLRMEHVRFKHLELIGTRGRQVLLILVFEGGEVRQQTFLLDEPVTQKRLSALSTTLNQRLQGRGAKFVLDEQASAPNPLERDVLDVIYEELTKKDVTFTGELYHDGLMNVLAEPEFSEPSVAQQALRIIEGQSVLDEVFSQTVFSSEDEGVHVLIGGEKTWEELRDCSVVVAQYGSSGVSLGAVGVLGPMRMSYGKMVSTVQFVSDLMSELIQESMLEEE